MEETSLVGIMPNCMYKNVISSQSLIRGFQPEYGNIILTDDYGQAYSNRVIFDSCAFDINSWKSKRLNKVLNKYLYNIIKQNLNTNVEIIIWSYSCMITDFWLAKNCQQKVQRAVLQATLSVYWMRSSQARYIMWLIDGIVFFLYMESLVYADKPQSIAVLTLQICQDKNNNHCHISSFPNKRKFNRTVLG